MHSYWQCFKIKFKKIYIDKEAYPEQRDLFLKEVEAIPFEDYAYALQGQEIYATCSSNRIKFNKKITRGAFFL
jgi:hypothetical protein